MTHLTALQALDETVELPTELAAMLPFVVLVVTSLAVKASGDGNEGYGRRVVALVLSVAAAAGEQVLAEGGFRPATAAVVAVGTFLTSGLIHDAAKGLGVDLNQIRALLPAAGLDAATLPLSPARRAAASAAQAPPSSGPSGLWEG